MINHFLELFSFYRRLLLGGALYTALFALLLSMFLLLANPLYKAVATVTMQPTEAELAYTQGWLGVSQFNPASILTQTHIEQILSRPVAEKALQLLSQEAAETQTNSSGFKQGLEKLGRGLKQLFWQTWNTLNYGKHVPLSEEEELLVTLMEATDVEVVEGSYIINIEVLYKNPQIAAKVANTMAEAYVAQTQNDYALHAQGLREGLQTLIGDKESKLTLLIDEELKLRRLLKISDIGIERESLIESRDREQEKRTEDEIRLSELLSRVESLQGEGKRPNRRELINRIETELALGEAERNGLLSRISERRHGILALDNKLLELQDKERRFRQIEQRKDEIRADLEDLRRRQVTVSLADAGRLPQVKMISPSVAPLYPWFPKVLLTTVAAAIVGFVMMLLLVVVLDTTGRSVITSEGLFRFVGINSLGLIHIGSGRWFNRTGWVKVSAPFMLKRIAIVGADFQQGVYITAVNDLGVIEQAEEKLTRLLGAVPIRTLPVISSGSFLPEQSDSSEPVICLLKPGEIDESELVRLYERCKFCLGQERAFFALWQA